MTVRSIAQVMAAVVAGAVLVGLPAWAFASAPDDRARPSSGLTGVMSSPGSQGQMMGSMSTMMDDSAMREQMRSVMSTSMSRMSGMPSDGMSGCSTSGMGQRRGVGRGSMSGRSTNQ